MILLPRQFTQQPRSLARTAGPLAAGIAHAWAQNVYGLGVYDSAAIANGAFGVGSGGTTGNAWTVNARGDYTLNFSDNGTGTVASTVVTVGDSSGSGAPSSSVFSIQARVRLGSLGAAAQHIYSGGTSGAIGFRIEPGGAVGLTKTSTAAIGSSAVSLSAGADYDIGVSYDGTTALFYVDGIASGSGSNAQSFALNSQHFLGSEDSAGSLERISNGSRIDYLCVWNRVRTPAEFKAVRDNNWQIFAPLPRRIWAPTTAGGAAFIARQPYQVNQSLNRSASF